MCRLNPDRSDGDRDAAGARAVTGADGRLPGLESSLSAYEAVLEWEREGAVPVEVLAERTDETREGLRRSLGLLVAYGLLDRTPEGYVVRCRPDESVERWRARAADRAETLHEAVSRATGDGPGDGTGTLQKDGARYDAVAVDARTGLEDLLGRVEGAPTDGRDGVVLTAPGEDANEVQRLVDDLERSDRSSLEMVDAEVVELTTGFEYRSYLAPA
jgi:hypothetical protein